MTMNAETAPKKEPEKQSVLVTLLVLFVLLVIGIIVIGAFQKLYTWVFGDIAPVAAEQSAPKVRLLDLHAMNRFACNTDSMPESINTADVSATFYRDGDVLVLSGEVRTDGVWEPHGKGLRYKSLMTSNNAGSVRTVTPTWFYVDRAVVVGERGGKSLVRLEGEETLHCISEFR